MNSSIELHAIHLYKFAIFYMVVKVPEPKDLTDDELLQVLDSEDPTQFRIPMSIGEPHAEIDKCE